MAVTATKAFVVLLSAGVAVLLWSWAKGNQEILVLPFASWLGVMLWPCERVVDPGRAKSRDDSIRRCTMTTTAACIVWLLAGATMACRQRDSRASTSQIDSRMDVADQCYREGDYEDALNLISSLVVPDGMPQQNARKHHNLGVILIRLGRTNEAAEVLKLALQYDARNAEAAYLLAALASLDGDVDLAREMADRALSVNPGHRAALRLKTEMLRASARSQ